MAIAIPDLSDNQDIVVGHAKLIARKDKDGQPYWEIPGGYILTSKEDAIAYATRLDSMIKTNVKRTGRNLIWS